MSKLKKMCDCCQKTEKTKEYFFTNGEIKWSRWWCNKCLNRWKQKCKDLHTAVQATLLDLNTP